MKPLPTLIGAMALAVGLVGAYVVIQRYWAKTFWDEWTAADRSVAASSVGILNGDWPDGRNSTSPLLATDGKGNWVAVWASEKPGETAGWGADSDILFATSTDNAETWSKPGALNPGAAIDSAGDHWPSVAYDSGSGAFAVVWAAARPGQPADLLYDISVASCTDAFAPGAADPCTWQAKIISPAGMSIDGQAHPVIASDGNGVWVVLWEAGDELGGSIAITRSIHGRRSADLQSWVPVAAAGGLSGIVNHTGCRDCALGNANAPAVAYGNGKWIAVWQSSRGHPATAYPHPDPSPWGTDFDILFATSSDGIAWTATKPLAPGYAGADHADPAYVAGLTAPSDETPVIATNGAGKWVAAWRSNMLSFTAHGGAKIAAGEDYDIVYAFSVDNGGTWVGPYPVPGADADNAAPAIEDAHPAIAALGSGNWGVAWQSVFDATGSLGSDYDILFTLLTANDQRPDLAAITPVGGLKAMAPTAETDAGSNDETPAIASDGKARFAAAWSSLADPPGLQTNSWNILWSTLDLPAPN